MTTHKPVTEADIAAALRALADKFDTAANAWLTEADASGRAAVKSSFRGHSGIPTEALAAARGQAFQAAAKDVREALAALPEPEPTAREDELEYVWLIERHGPLPYENEDRTGWTADPLSAHRYATKQEADGQRQHRGYTAESVEHGFIPQPTAREETPMTDEMYPGANEERARLHERQAEFDAEFAAAVTLVPGQYIDCNAAIPPYGWPCHLRQGHAGDHSPDGPILTALAETSQQASPTLTIGQTVRVDDIEYAVLREPGATTPFLAPIGSTPDEPPPGYRPPKPPHRPDIKQWA